jgi:L-alanine-DL-glutamate epimerase-like enolase superfamily enzyme
LITIESVSIEKRTSPLHSPFVTALRRVSEIESIQFKLLLDDGRIAKGECVATPAIMGDSIEQIERDLKRVKEEELPKIALNLPISNSARAAVDFALWSLCNEIRPVSIKTDVTIPICDISELSNLLDHRIEEGFSVMKLKVGQETLSDLRARIEIIAAREISGLLIRIDPNQSWSMEYALSAMNLLGEFADLIEYVEQPLSKFSLDDNLKLKQSSDIALMVDETLMGLDDVNRIIDIGAFSWANIKLIKAGGIYPALQMANQLSEAGIKVSIGSMMESEFGLYSAAQLAHLVNPLSVHDLDAAWWLKEKTVSYENGILKT